MLNLSYKTFLDKNIVIRLYYIYFQDIFSYVVVQQRHKSTNVLDTHISAYFIEIIFLFDYT